ncbi:hypothetical protein COOONC_00451 [Cooperia oncophora]
MDLNDVEKLLVAYMGVDSTTGNEGPFGDFVAESLRDNGWIVEKQALDNNSSRFNILATRKPLKGAPSRIVFNTHLDTVPPYIPPREDDMNIYGRGSNDAKGQLACMVSAAQAFGELSSRPC